MTSLAANDTRVIWEALVSRYDHPPGAGRWVRVGLSLADLTSATRFLVSAERLLYEMEGTDEQSRQYGLHNWQGGVISGARYAFRALKAPTKQICLHKLRGRLGSEDVWAVSAAASLAVSRLLGRPEVPLDLGGWDVDVYRAKPAEDSSESTKAASSELEPPPERCESHSPAFGRTDPDQPGQAILAEPDTAADGGRDPGSS